MIKNKLLTLIIFFLLIANLRGQNENKFFTIGLIPTYLIDPITPSIGIALEHSLTKKINGELMYGYDPNLKIFNFHKDPSSRHHEYKLTLKYLKQAKAPP